MSTAPAPPRSHVPDSVPADVLVDEELVRDLVASQHPDLAGPVRRFAEGYDNVLFRVGPAWLARMPRRRAGALTLRRETEVLPHLAGTLGPFELPWPRREGVPSGRYPYPWALVRWHDGHLPDPHTSSPARSRRIADLLARLHRAAPSGPTDAARSMPLRHRDDALRRHLAELPCLAAERPLLLDRWERALAASPWSGPPVWVHGDLHPFNLLERDGAITVVLDWGDAFVGDPAPDLAAAWMLLDPEHHGPVRERVDAATWARGLGWTVWLRVMLGQAVAHGAPSFRPITDALSRRLAQSDG